ncbi:apolipoprotein N-acyltransferase [Geomonas sp. RF6]|uniref:apolipoprotein N-acyltransferase n=1 Tax=Geomonas sp. RF6 TaxID=2897342 RepID=UPI001E479359|nr:apolipoprotein N-acyltransferase [Geomonas sp. RF6]UFS69068.1 apolipoprotein N-acyltransferase [Geomonas sp. RF6]
MSQLRFPSFPASRGYLLAAGSGLALALSFPSPGLSLLAWCAFVPLFVAARGASPGGAFRLGFAGGVVAYAGILYWLNIVMVTYGKLPAAVSVVLYLVLCCYLALYPATVLFLTRKWEVRGVSPLLSFPVLWVAGELIRSYLLTGFPWASLGYSQYRTLPLIQISDLAGVYGVSFLLAFANVVLYQVWRFFAAKERYPVRGIVVLIVLLGGTLAYGISALNRAEGGNPQRVLLVQGNIPQDVKWNPAFQETTVATYERLSRNGYHLPGTLVVWPESALPFFFQSDLAYAGRVRALATQLQSALLVGSPAYEGDGERVRYLNSAFLISREGEVVGRSDKMHLVPFGEYVPLAQLLPFVSKMVVGIGDFTAGEKAVPLQTGGGKVGVLVCFEGIFPEVSRAYVAAGAHMLVNITNDAWFGKSSAPYQHLSMTVFRAVENRVPLVRAANTGISCIIDSKGHIRGVTDLFQEATLSGSVRLGTGESTYTRIGDVFAYACLVLSGALGVRTWRRRESPLQTDPAGATE